MAILRRCITSSRFSTGKRSMWIQISRLLIDNLRTLSSGCVTGWGGCCCGQRWCQLWSQLSASVGRSCTKSFASPLCLQLFCGAIVGRKAFSRGILTNHSWMSFYRSVRPLYAKETQHPACSHLRPRFEVSWLHIAFPPFWRTKTLLW